MTTVTICGNEYKLKRFDNFVFIEDVCAHGYIKFAEREIGIRNNVANELHTLIHELIHGVVAHSNVTELTDAHGEHLEVPIDKLALGIAEALQSMEK